MTRKPPGLSVIEMARAAKARLLRVDSARTRQILVTALEQFAEDGYDGTTVQAIARRLGIKHSLIYYYFRSKDDLFNAALMFAIEEAETAYAAVAGGERDPLRRLDSWLEVNVRMTGPLTRNFRIMMEHGANDRATAPAFVSKAVALFYELEVGLLTGIIAQGIERGDFRCPDPGRAARLISRSLDGLYFGVVVRRDVTIEDGIEELRGLARSLLAVKSQERE